ncbi:hypothetical protein OEZ85_007304 [Tetradesmus obliquus]|uniref:Uncharacterized protein n=2 Tax=Tetradesmus obliquus TaxID=3088 RepID=A0ABY8TX90_TETOB|nr:hypothetical protein OEZ85_007304 [Tetradesmus obliquus]|eukprot:jgi/Sobl393_1/6108/SZX61535.1
MQGKMGPGALVVPAAPAGPNGISLCTPKSARFRVYDLVEDAPPKNFHEAAERGDTNYLVKTIERTIDFDINMTDKTGRTALHWAAECNQIEAAQTLIDYGCNVKALEGMGRTAVHMAARAAGAEMLGVLLDALPEQERTDLINTADRSGITAVFLAFQRGEEGASCFEYLMAHGARYNQQSLEELGATAAAGGQD